MLKIFIYHSTTWFRLPKKMSYWLYLSRLLMGKRMIFAKSQKDLDKMREVLSLTIL